MHKEGGDTMAVTRIVVPFALLAMLGCAQQQPAKVVFKGSQVFDQSQQYASAHDYSSHANARFSHSSEYLYPNAQPIESPSVMAAPVGTIKSKEIAVLDVDAPEAEEVAEVRVEQRDSFLPESLFNADTNAYKDEVPEKPVALDMNAFGVTPVAKIESPISSPVAASAELAQSSFERSNGVYFDWPVHGNIISSFGQKENGQFNDGINIVAPAGAPIRSVADGVVVYSGNELKGYGNMVIVRHDDGWMSAYAHADELWVQPDDRVRQGDKIATVGMSGNVNMAQLHFGLRKGRDAVDPTKYLAQSVAVAQ